MRSRIEADIEKVLAPYFETIEHAMLFTNHQGEVIVSEHPDLGARMAAAERLLDRVYGKSTTPIEHTGDVIDSLDELCAALDDDGLAELQRLAARVRS